MDAFTHSLVAVALWRARAVPRHTGLWGAATLLLATNAAEGESLLRLGGTALYIRNYHGAAHSLLSALVLAIGVAGLAALALKQANARKSWPKATSARLHGLKALIRAVPPCGMRERSPQPLAHPAGRDGSVSSETFAIRFSSLLWIALIGAGSHLLLDLFQGYGERVLWPFSSARYGVSLMAGYDVANLAALLLALAIPLLLNVVNSEVGARRIDPAPGALIGLIVLAALLPVRYMLRTRADSAAASALVQEEESYSVHPSPFLPWRWYMVQETSLSYLAQEVDAIGQRALPGIVRFRKPQPNSLLIAAGNTESGRAFLDLAGYPLYTLEEGRRGMVVRIRDMQFYIPGASPRPYSLEVEINSQLKFLGDTVTF